MILSFLNQKGGVGKSTLAINAAGFYSNRRESVLLIDADPQGTTTRWAELRASMPFPVVHLSRENMSTEIVTIGSNYDRVVIDGPPRAEALSRAVIIASDLVVLPIEPSGASDWASQVTIRQVQEAQTYKSDLKAAFIVSRAISRTVISTTIREHMLDAGLPLLKSTIFNRVAFAESMTMGATIYEWAPHSDAVRDITRSMSEIEEFYNDQESFQASPPAKP